MGVTQLKLGIFQSGQKQDSGTGFANGSKNNDHSLEKIQEMQYDNFMQELFPLFN